MIVREGVGDVYIRTITLNHTHARRLENKSLPAKHICVYTTTQAIYIGNESEQSFQLPVATAAIMARALDLYDVDLADVWVKAAVSGAVVHIIGTVCAGGWIATQRTE